MYEINIFVKNKEKRVWFLTKVISGTQNKSESI